MSSRRAFDCKTIISLAQRFKREGLFGELNNWLGGFGYHFWRHSREKQKQGILPVLPKDEGMRGAVAMTKRSIETFVFCQCLRTCSMDLFDNPVSYRTSLQKMWIS
jgi:hypothetical protein